MVLRRFPFVGRQEHKSSEEQCGSRCLEEQRLPNAVRRRKTLDNHQSTSKQLKQLTEKEEGQEHEEPASPTFKNNTFLDGGGDLDSDLSADTLHSVSRRGSEVGTGREKQVQ